MAGDAATNAATKVRPDEEKLAQIDEPAADNTWHEKPDFSKENLKKQAQGIYGGNPKEDAADIAKASHAQGQAHAQTQSANPQNPQDVDFNRAAAEDTARNVARQKMDANFDDETRQKVKERNEEYRRRATEYFGKKMPQ